MSTQNLFKEKRKKINNMNGISSKLASAGLAGAVTGVLVWVASLLGLDIPGEVAVYLSTIVAVVVGYIVPETRAIPVENAVISATVSEEQPK